MFRGMDAKQWLQQVTDDPLNEIARRSGIPQRTLYNQLDKRTLSAENIIRVAETYGRHPLRALIDTGHINAAWARMPDVEAALRLATDDQLADEILRRLKLASGESVFDEPVDQLADRRRKPAEVPIIRAASRRDKELTEDTSDLGEESQAPDDDDWTGA